MNEEPIPLNYQILTESPFSGWAAIRWWETRRFLYNGVMLLLGLIVTGGAWGICALGKVDLQMPSFFLLFDIIIYAFCANVCYTGGWILNLAWKEPDPAAGARRRRGIFLAGLIFSCLITTVPLWLAIGAVVLKHL